MGAPSKPWLRQRMKPKKTWSAIALVWCTLDEDLCPEVEADDRTPDWFLEEDANLAEMMGVGGWEQWAMENGFAGGQEILLRFWYPVWTRDYWGEWDVEYQYDIAGFIPMPVEQAAAFWEEWLARRMGPALDSEET